MATIEKLVKAVEGLKVFPVSTPEDPKKRENIPSKKDKISHCNAVCECICSQNMRTLTEFPKFLGIAMETFLTLCDDPEADVRLVTDECINKTITALSETNLGRIQVELYKEIKKNGSSRCLRAALSRFASLSHLIRPQKCRPYVQNLVPCIARICRRPEDPIQETLSSCMPKLSEALMCFASDAEIKVLLKSFLPNLASDNSTCQRAAAISLTLVCQHSRSPSTFFRSTLDAILGHLVPVEEAVHVPTILGCLLIIRHFIPHVLNPPNDHDRIKGSFGITKSEKELRLSVEHLLQVYELLLHFTLHDDHNIVTTTLEALQQFLRLMSEDLVKRLTERNSVVSSQIHASEATKLPKQRSHSISTLPLVIDDQDVLDDPDPGDGDLEYQQSSDPLSVLSTGDSVELEDSTAFYQRSHDQAAMSSDKSDKVVMDTSYSSVEIGRINDDPSDMSSRSGLSHSDSQDTLRSQSPNRHASYIEDDINGNHEIGEISDENAADDAFIPASSADSAANLSSSFPNIGPIGTFTDGEISLVYCARLLCRRFLLGGQEQVLMDDRSVRISIKVLSLSCLCHILRHCPRVLAYRLFASSDDADCQQVKDALLYTSHHDPQLKGNAALLIGQLVSTALICSNGNFKQWLTSDKNTMQLDVTLESLIHTLVAITEDNSAVAVRLATVALRKCVPHLLTSCHSQLGLDTVLKMARVRDNPYWLVKVELLNIICEMDFRVMAYLEHIASSVKHGEHHYLGSINIQKSLLHDVLLDLLSDEDTRVRNHASSVLVKLIPRLFFGSETRHHDAITAIAAHFTATHLSPTLQEWSYNTTPLVLGLVAPYSHQQPHVAATTTTIESNLSRVVTAIFSRLSQPRSKFTAHGCCHALLLLSRHYPVTCYPPAWGVATPVPLVTHDTSGRAGIKPFHKRSTSISSLEATVSCGGGSLPIILSLITSSPLGLDLSSHQDALELAGNLFAGSAANCLRTCDDPSPLDTPGDEARWLTLGDRILASFADRLFTHIAKILNICYHIMEEMTPGPPPFKALPSLPNNPILSPIKRKSKTDPIPKDAGHTTPDSKGASKAAKSQEKDREFDKDRAKKDGISSFYNFPFYMKLYEVLRGAHSNYKVTLECDTNDKFRGLLRATLNVLSQILEIATLSDVSDKCEVLLTYMKSCVSVEAPATVTAVHQLLKALFGTNLASQVDHGPVSNVARKPGKAARVNPACRPGLYYSCFTLPYSQLTQALSAAAYRASTSLEQDDATTFNWLKRRVERKVPAILKNTSKVDKTSIATYIRMFEPLVIKALKQYTVTSGVELQRGVLSLLCQLVQLRVNYCLLDADQIFLQFVLKQFEFIEEGQIRNSEILVPAIFQFLVMLTYEKFNSNAVTVMPKIIQLCDGIMASGLQASTHVIPAIQTIVYDLFLVRGNKGELAREVDTQREVVISVLLRILDHPQILELMTIVLHWSRKDGEDKWKRLSRQITDLLLPMLVKHQVRIDSQVDLDILYRLFECVAASVFRPVDIILKHLFTSPPAQGDGSVNLERLMCLVLSMLRVLITQSKEEVVLSRLHELRLTIPSFLRITSDQDVSRDVPPDHLLTRFLLQLVHVVSTEITSHCHSDHKRQMPFLCQQLAHFLLYFTHMLQSGCFRRIAAAATKLVKPSPATNFAIPTTNATFLSLGLTFPTLCLQWSNILNLLSYDDMDWWSAILRTPHSYKSLGVSSNDPNSLQTARQVQPCHTCLLTLCPCAICSAERKSPRSPVLNCNTEIMRRGALIVFSDFVSENLVETEHMTWLIINHVNDLIELCHEPPIHEFISAIHRNSAASGLFIQAIHARCHNFSRPSLIKKTLSCLEAIHVSQCAPLLALLIDKFLTTTQVAVSRYCDIIACRRVEMLLAEPDARRQIPQDELEKMLEFMRSHQLSHRHPQLVSLLVKLHGLITNEPVLSLSPHKSHPLIQTTEDIDQIRIDQAMYVRIVKEQCYHPGADPKECALLLQRLEYADILNIIMCEEFRLSILKGCINLGLMRTLVSYSRTCDQFENSTHDSPQRPPQPSYDDLFKAASLTLFRHINNMINHLPVPHEVLVFNVTATPRELRYRQSLDSYLSEETEVFAVFHLTSALVQYLQSLRHVPWLEDFPSESVSDSCRLVILCLEIITWQLHKDILPTSEFLEVTLTCLDLALQNQKLCEFFGKKENISWVCVAVSSVHQILSSMLIIPGDHLAILPNHEMRQDQASGSFDESRHMIASCDKVGELLECLKTRFSPVSASTLSISDSLISNIIIGLSRFTVVNSWSRTPPLVWKLGWLPSPSDDIVTAVPPVPLNYLLDKDVLKEFIFRINVLGWTSRQQFEETWMGLLGVLNSGTMNPDIPLTPEEDLERNQTLVLAVRAISSLLIQSTLTPQAGNPNNSFFDRQPRDKPLIFLQTRCGKKLGFVRSLVEKEIHALLNNIKKGRLEQQMCSTHQGLKYLFEENLERNFETDDYTWGQISVNTVWALTGMLDQSPAMSDTTDSVDSPDTDAVPQRHLLTPDFRGRVPAAMNNVDIHSCLQFLLELYGQWLDPNTTPQTPLMLLNESVKSVVVLSDLFHDISQFEWMQSVLMEVYRAHPAEDEITNQYLNVGICKAAAVIGLDAAMGEKIVRLVESGLRSTHLTSRVATLQGVLYVLELGKSDTSQQLVTMTMEYIIKQIGAVSSACLMSQQFLLALWSVGFYIMENFQDYLIDTEHHTSFMQATLTYASSNDDVTSLAVYILLLRGWERLLLADVLSKSDCDTLIKLSVERMCLPSPQRALPALGLLLTCMYTGKQLDQYSPQPRETTFYDTESSTDLFTDPESLILAMERVSVLFDRIRKGTPYEAQVIARILPAFLSDFFPPQDIMNKVIGEFISNQQPHPQLIAKVVFQVFSNLLGTQQKGVVLNWVMLSLSNFTQRTPVAMAIWSLTCFFISASSNPWQRALFPHVLCRIAKLEILDRRLFLLAAKDFWGQLTDETQKRSFVSTFQSVCQTDSLYRELVALLPT